MSLFNSNSILLHLTTLTWSCFLITTSRILFANLRAVTECLNYPDAGDIVHKRIIFELSGCMLAPNILIISEFVLKGFLATELIRQEERQLKLSVTNFLRTSTYFPTWPRCAAAISEPHNSMKSIRLLSASLRLITTCDFLFNSDTSILKALCANCSLIDCAYLRI